MKKWSFILVTDIISVVRIEKEKNSEQFICVQQHDGPFDCVSTRTPSNTDATHKLSVTDTFIFCSTMLWTTAVLSMQKVMANQHASAPITSFSAHSLVYRWRCVEIESDLVVL